jgi:hypothetical protein
MISKKIHVFWFVMPRSLEGKGGVALCHEGIMGVVV